MLNTRNCLRSTRHLSSRMLVSLSVALCSAFLTTTALARETAPQVTYAPSNQKPLEIPSNLFALSHPIGQQRLLQSDYRQPYWLLATYFETQRNQAYCSVASSVIVLNALGLPRPANALYPDFPFFTQQDFFTPADKRIADPDVVAKEGMTMDQLSAMLGHYPVSQQKIFGDTLNEQSFRELLKKNLREDDRFVLLNFNRRMTGEIGGGHWSPLAAYHEPSDSVLLMDVARYKYPPVWVPLKDLLLGAQDPDSVSNKPRGVLIISKKP